MLAFLVPTTTEARFITRALDSHKRLQDRPLLAYSGSYGGKPYLVAVVGVGEKAPQAMASIADRYPLTGIVSLGFAGAVDGGLREGDLMVCPKVYALTEAKGLSSPLFSDPSLLQAASRLEPLTGDSLTIPRIASPEDKREIGASFPVKIVEMEVYWLAQAAQERGIPFLATRVVLERRDEDISRMGRFLSPEGKPREARALAYLASHPHRAPRFLWLWRRSRVAGRSLTAFAALFLEKMGE